MMRVALLLSAALFASFSNFVRSAESPEFSGTWNVTVQFDRGTQSTVLTLTDSNGRYEGQSGPLDEGGYFRLTYTGKREGRALILTPAIGPLLAGPVGILLGTPHVVAKLRKDVLAQIGPP